MSKFKNEAELAAKLEQWLKDNGWEVFKEVQYGMGHWDYTRADIIARKGTMLWGIECKNTLNDGVLEQALNLRKCVHKSSVAVPLSNNHNYKLSKVKKSFLDTNGIGLLFVNPGDNYWHREPVYEEIEAKYCRTFKNFYRKGLLKYIKKTNNGLTEYHKLVEASTQWGGYISDFVHTNLKVIEYLLKNGPTKLSTIFKNIEHHYSTNSSASSNFGNGITCGFVKGLERKDGKICVKCGIIKPEDILKE